MKDGGSESMDPLANRSYAKELECRHWSLSRTAVPQKLLR